MKADGESRRPHSVVSMTADVHPLEGERSADLQWSARALELALQADFRTSPNPMVGAVVLDREGHLAGEGYHRAQGQPHAEEEALAQAGEGARGGTLYVNLEPCTHAHRTPCCADAVIEARIARAVISMIDPDPRVRGAGVEKLNAAGIQTTLTSSAQQGVRWAWVHGSRLTYRVPLLAPSPAWARA